MNGIYIKDGIYVLIDNNIQNDICIYHYTNKDNVSLYGGRINIKYVTEDTATLLVDGISIVNMGTTEMVNTLNLHTIISHLNAIEANGVEAFLENYRKSVEFLYNEVKELNKIIETRINSEQDDSKIKMLMTELEKITKLLFSILPILFSLYSYMKAGIENDKVLSIYQSILDTIA